MLQRHRPDFGHFPALTVFRMKKTLFFWALISVAAILSPGVSAQTPAPAPTATAVPPLTPAEAQQAVEFLQDPQKRQQLITALRAIAAGAPLAAPPTAAAPEAAPAPAATSPTPAIVLAPNSLGAQLLVALSRWSGRLAGETTAMAQATTNLPTLWQWLVDMATDPVASTAVLLAFAWAASIVAVALILEFLCGLVLRRPRDALTAHLPRGDGDNIRLLRLVPLVLARLLFDLVPVAVFAATGNLLAATITVLTQETRLVVLAVVNAYAICRAVMCVARVLVSPDDRRRRLWRLDDASARFVIAWLRRIVVVAVFGDAIVGVALLLGLDQSAHDGLQRLIALILAVLLVIVVIRSRQRVAGYIRRSGVAGEAPRWRGWLAEAWPYLAVVTIASAWVGAASGTRTGVAALYFPGVTLAVVIGARLVEIVVLGGLDRLLRLDPQAQDKLPGLNQRIIRYRQPLAYAAVAVIAAVSLVVLLQLWGAPAFAWFAEGGIGHRLLSALVTIAVAILAAVAIWEVTQAVLEGQLARLGDDGSRARSARLMTLMPILRTVFLAAILTVVGLTALSEIGVTIAPLLAGAGIIGIAVGFGSQHLVQDVITGVFVLFENAIQIGDSVTVAGLSGNIEQLSVRTIRLRAGDGSVHTIPFSSVTTITNSNRGLGNAAVSVTVAYEEDTDRVAAVLAEIAAGMREEDEFKSRVLGDLQLFGVDAIRPWGTTITGQIACTDTGRWPVQREFNRRVKKRFEAEGIALAAPPAASA
jgi:small-conductance mechanosensitive channel